MSCDITPLLWSLVPFEDDSGGAGAKAAILVTEGNAAWLEADTMEVGLVAVFLEMSAAVAQLTDPDEGTGLDTMSLAHAPSTLITQLLVGLVPGAVYSLLDPVDVTRIEGGSGWGKGMGDVTTKAAIGIRPSEVAGRLSQPEPLVGQLFSEVRQLSCPTDDLSATSSVSDDLCA